MHFLFFTFLGNFSLALNIGFVNIVMVGKDIRKLTQKRKVGKKKGRATKHKSRPSLKACDPFSGRSYREKDSSEYNLDPEKEELDGYEDNEQDDLKSYSSFREKPNYRRGSKFIF